MPGRTRCLRARFSQDRGSKHMNRLPAALTAALLLLSSVARAQIATTTSLVGTVTDSSGKTVIGAKVVAVNTGTLDTYSTETNEQGYYRIEFIRIGSYKLTVEQPGF